MRGFWKYQEFRKTKAQTFSSKKWQQYVKRTRVRGGLQKNLTLCRITKLFFLYTIRKARSTAFQPCTGWLFNWFRPSVENGKSRFVPKNRGCQKSHGLKELFHWFFWMISYLFVIDMHQNRITTSDHFHSFPALIWWIVLRRCPISNNNLAAEQYHNFGTLTLALYL